MVVPMGGAAWPPLVHSFLGPVRSGLVAIGGKDNCTPIRGETSILFDREVATCAFGIVPITIVVHVLPLRMRL